MAIAYRASAHNYNAGATSLTVDKPTGTVNGDVMVAIIYANGSTTTITEPAGWTLVRGYGNVGGSYVWQTPFITAVVGVFVKVASSEGANYTWNLGSSQRVSCVISSFSGVDNTTPVNAHEGATNASTPTVGGITTNIDGCMLLWAANYDDGGNYTWTDPSGYSNAAVSATAGKCTIGYKSQTTQGSTGTLTPSLSGSVSNLIFNLALAPATGGGGTAYVKTIDGVTFANFKTRDTISKANTKTIDTITTT